MERGDMIMERKVKDMKLNAFFVIGILIYILYSVIDRFIVRISNIIAIPIIVIGLLCIAIGFFIMKK